MRLEVEQKVFFDPTCRGGWGARDAVNAPFCAPSAPEQLLDGGQFVLLLLEGLRGRPLPEKFQMAFMQSGFVFLVGLSLVLIVKDTSQLAAVQQLLGR